MRDIAPDAGALVGNKALNLARMLDSGFPVPRGFCITVGAYEEHLQRTGLSAPESSCISSPDLAALREAMLSTPLSDALRDEVASEYRALKTERVAVRSSALLEDLPERSFAGLLETFLDVDGIEACLTALKCCWASCWSERACVYRERNELSHHEARMAVVVQRFIPAEVSGVVFTGDPRSGRRDRIIIEAGGGTGSDLVSGRLTPERCVVSRKDCSVLSHSQREGEVTRLLSRRLARRLARIGVKAERIFQSPQDMEWAVSRRKVYLLQSRPITALPPEPSWEDCQIWSNVNVGEVVPDVVSPMTFSFVKVLLAALFKPICDVIDMDLSETPLFDLVAGRLYFNLNSLVIMFKRIPGSSEGGLDALMGGRQGHVLGDEQLELLAADAFDLRGGRIGPLWRLPRFLLHLIRCRTSVAERFVRQMREKNDALIEKDVASLPEHELVRETVSAIHAAAETWDISYNVPGFAGFDGLQRVCRRWLGDDDGSLVGTLLAGTGGMEDAQSGIDLLDMAMFARDRSPVSTILLADEPWAATREKLAKEQVGCEFLMQWDRFMKRHGHHARGEVEVANPRWSERPDYVLALVRSYMGNAVDRRPGECPDAVHCRRDECEQECLRRLRNPLKRLAFKYLLNLARRGLVLRENMKSEGVRYIAWLRTLLLHAGKRLSEKGLLRQREDIFFLEVDELALIAEGAHRIDFHETVAARRAEHSKWQSVTSPHVIVGRFDLETSLPDAVDANARVLAGLGVSPGVVTGKARVILRSETDQQMRPGEILVAPFADPGWVPYFVCAAGLVMDMGGLLSHGCIVAREYGIPTVVNVGPATEIIKSGQTIQLDGARGLVRILG